uniref:ribosomal protein L32 n=1 Tax=Clematis connata TaxID=1857123 RepID=UPI0021154AE6|nr:ribosomal protein L32 [Clematis connata]UTD45719.1 ribosomal protein L32 [Clematis connata]
MNNLRILEWRFKKSIKIFGKIKVYWAGIKAFSLAKSLSTGNSKSFFVQQTSNILYNK